MKKVLFGLLGLLTFVITCSVVDEAMRDHERKQQQIARELAQQQSMHVINLNN